MPLTTTRIRQLLSRDIDPLTYSTDEREARTARNTPLIWRLEHHMPDYWTDDEVHDLLSRFGAALDPTCPTSACKVLDTLSYDDGAADWQTREVDRFSTDYVCVPWADEYWYRPLANLHFAHLSLKQLGKIAFTMSEAHGEADRQTIISPGKYLLRYFGEWINQANIDAYCAAIDAQTKHLTTPLQFAHTSEDIVRVYRRGPSSCMSHASDHEDYRTGGIHPVSVYGAGDLAIAYFTEHEHVKARCIVWPDKKIYGRLYGDGNRLKLLLHRDGFTAAKHASDWNGARLLKRAVPNGDGYICPYLDIGSQCVTIAKDYIIVQDDGDYTADDVAAVIAGDGYDANDTYNYYCENCNEGISDDDVCYVNGDGCYCGQCYRRNWEQCAGCDTDVERGTTTEVHTRYSRESYCEDCVSQNATLCQHCGQLYTSRASVSITHPSYEDAETFVCGTCVDRGNVVRRRCGHYAPSDSYETCYCGCPADLPSRVIYSNRPLVIGGAR